MYGVTLYNMSVGLSEPYFFYRKPSLHHLNATKTQRFQMEGGLGEWKVD